MVLLFKQGIYIIGDIDGVIVVPQADDRNVLYEAAEAKVAKDEAREHEALHNGEQSIRAYLAKVSKIKKREPSPHR